MPTISMFYGIIIKMFFRDNERHKLPHIHAEYQGHVGVYSIPEGELLAGSLPKWLWGQFFILDNWGIKMILGDVKA
jgi:hypothetical protein